MDAREHDQVGVGALRLPGEAERVAEKVGHVLDVGVLVVVGQDDRVLLLFEAGDLGEQVERWIDLGVEKANGGVQNREVEHGAGGLPFSTHKPQARSAFARW